METATPQKHDDAHHSGDHDATTTMARPPTITVSEACATAEATESKVVAPKEEERQSISQSFPSEHYLSSAPPAEQPAHPHNNGFASDEAEINDQTAVIADLKASLQDLERANARVALLQANFDKFEALEKDLGIYEMLGADGDREYRERVEVIKQQRSVLVADKMMFSY